MSVESGPAFASVPEGFPLNIAVRGARQNNLRDLDVDVPLWRTVAIVGVSGSGKTSLAIGTLFAEGMQRFLNGLPAYTRRRITQAQRPDVDRIEHLPPAAALRQRPPSPGPRSTVGTMTELLNVARVMMSRLGTHRCPNGHSVAPDAANQGGTIICPTCAVEFKRPSAESFAFNSQGACPVCKGLGRRLAANESALVPDPALSISEGAVLSWNTGAKRLSRFAAEQLGVPIDTAYRDLSDAQRRLVMHGPPVEVKIKVRQNTARPVTLRVKYESAVAAAERSLMSESAAVRTQAASFVASLPCSACGGSRLSPEALSSTLDGRNLAEISALELQRLTGFIDHLSTGISPELERVAQGLGKELRGKLDPLVTLGLGYLRLDRDGDTLSTGERQRLELTSTVRANTTGMLYVLDEPSVGLHPSNLDALRSTIRALAANGNSVVIVEHDVDVIAGVDWIIELGPGAGDQGGQIVTEGTPMAVAADSASLIGPFLSGTPAVTRDRAAPDPDRGTIRIAVRELYNLRDVAASFPIGGLTGVAGPSGAGKTALIFDSLVPAARAAFAREALPPHVSLVDLGSIESIVEIDAAPIGLNARSTPATYSGALDALRTIYSRTPEALANGWGRGYFSYNTKAGQCPTCLGLGEIAVDVQYLPDIVEPCPRCQGARYREEVQEIKVDGRSIADVLQLTVSQALEAFRGRNTVTALLQPIADVGLGYLRLGEPTPDLSGGESQRLRIASRLRSSQRGCLYVFDEPSTGLHPLDLRALVGVFGRLIDSGATIIVVDHDLDLLAAADKVIDMGPVGGPQGGRVVAEGTPEQVAADPASVTGRYLSSRLG